MAVDYTSENVSPLMNFFGSILSKNPNQLKFKYTGVDAVDYTEPTMIIAEKSKELIAYENVAKKSTRLKQYMDAGTITYFEDTTYYKGDKN